MIKTICLSACAIVLLICSCQNKEKKISVNQPGLERFLVANKDLKNYREPIRDFYTNRKFIPAWFENDKLNDKSKELLEALKTIREDSLYSPVFSYDSLVSLIERSDNEDTVKTLVEYALTASFMDYAENNFLTVSDDKLKRSGWNIRKKTPGAVELLDSLLKSNTNIDAYSPPNEFYQQLKKQLVNYYNIKRSGGWDVSKITVVKPGQKSEGIIQIRKLLVLTGDLQNDNTSNLFDKQLSEGIKNFQKRHGIEVSGMLDEKTVQTLKVPLEKRISQIKVNLMRLLKMPEEFKGDNVVVNIPEYVLYVYNDNKVQWTCNVVVGSDSTNTVVFNDSIEQIVFSPSWTIPKSIIIKETIPAVIENEDYLVNHNMEVVDKDGNIIDPSDVDWDDEEEFKYEIRQKPGENNSLGKVKFLLPNKHSIYLHDTPAKSLFTETERAFSHGCIRVSQPVKLAEYLLKDQKEWTTDSIKSAMNNEKELFVRLKTRVPVYLTYFTAWVNTDGKLNFRDDIYSQDEKLIRSE